jgi:hypothetical protein
MSSKADVSLVIVRFFSSLSRSDYAISPSETLSALITSSFVAKSLMLSMSALPCLHQLRIELAAPDDPLEYPEKKIHGPTGKWI